MGVSSGSLSLSNASELVHRDHNNTVMVKIYHTVPLKRNVASARTRIIANKRGVAHERNACHTSFISETCATLLLLAITE